MQEPITLPIVRPEAHRVHRRIREHDGMFFKHNTEPVVEQVVRNSCANDRPGLAAKLCTMSTVAEDLYPAQDWRELLARRICTPALVWRQTNAQTYPKETICKICFKRVSPHEFDGLDKSNTHV